MINWTSVIVSSLVVGLITFALLILLQKNKALHAKLNKYFHPEFIVMVFALTFIGTIISDYSRGESLLWSIYSSSIFFIIFLFIDFLIKKFWKKK